MIIIYAHPNKEGHCAYALELACDYLHARGIEFKVLDLYKMNYDPILKDSEHYTSGKRSISEDNRRIQDLIQEETKFLFIYPTWWQNMPAVLKGFVDRVFTPPFAYQFKKGIPFKNLKGKKAYIITTTGGPRLYTYFIVHDRSVKVLARDVLNFCGFKTRYSVIGRAKKIQQNRKVKIKKAIKKAFLYLR